MQYQNESTGDTMAEITPNPAAYTNIIFHTYVKFTETLV
jgi:hypothetical protein